MTTLKDLIALENNEPTGRLSLSALRALEGEAESSAPQGGVSVNPAAAQELKGRVSTLGLGLSDGLLFGNDDEVMRGIGAAIASLPGSKVDPVEFGNASMENARSVKSAAQEQHPGTFMGGQVLGGVATSVGAGSLLPAAGPVRTGMQAAGLGAGEGLAITAGAADGNMNAADLAKGAGVGAALGAAAVPIAAGAKAVTNMSVRPLGGLLGIGNTSRANSVVGRAVQRSGMSVDEINNRVQQAVIDGQPQFVIADALGSTGQGALSGVARSPGAGSQEIAEFLQSRQANAGDRVAQFIADDFDVKLTAEQRENLMRQTRSDRARLEYGQARSDAEPVDTRKVLEQIESRLSGMEGSGVDGDTVDAAFSRVRSRLSGTNSNNEGVQLSDFDRVLGVKQDLQDEIGAALRAGKNNMVRELSTLEQLLDEALEESSAAYRTANDNFRAASVDIEAIGKGGDASRPSLRADDTIDTFNRLPQDAPPVELPEVAGYLPAPTREGTEVAVRRPMPVQEYPPQARSAFRNGYADRLLARVEAQSAGSNRARPLMTDKASAELSEFAVNPDRLQRRIANENEMFETRNRAIGGSRTADNQANMEDVQSFDLGLMANILGGNWRTALTQGGQKTLDIAAGRNEATNQAIARILLSNDPQKALEPVMRQAVRSGRTNKLLEALLRHSAQNQVVQPHLIR